MASSSRRSSCRRQSRCSSLVEGLPVNGPWSVALCMRSLVRCDRLADAWDGLGARIERSWPGSGGALLNALTAVVVAAVVSLYYLIDFVHIYSQLCSVLVPFLSLICGYLLLTLALRHTWTPTGIYLTFCGSVVGETVGFFLSSALTFQDQVGHTCNFD